MRLRPTLALLVSRGSKKRFFVFFREYFEIALQFSYSMQCT